MSTILRAMTRDGSARAYVINSTDIVNEAISHHNTSPTATALLGRLLTASSVMGTMLPEPECTMTVAIRGNGIAGTTLCVSDYYGNVKGYVSNPCADKPLKPNGKLDVSGIVGGGILSVSKDVGDEVPYNGNIELVSGEVAEDIAQYYATSEQTPTLCALGVLVGKDYRCQSAGGVFVQLLPFPDEEVIAKLEENAKKLTNVSTLFDKGLSNVDVLKIALDGIEYDLFDELTVEYKCDCTRERTERALFSIGKKEVLQILSEQRENGEEEKITLDCHFCNKKYEFTKEQSLALFDKK
ncbi:MAG: Hsp33 family molecular chaperone HslO [Clostridia bacterium]|nr:Hsp33 family molecular chaperone HslO [Clostridia bacterium]